MNKVNVPLTAQQILWIFNLPYDWVNDMDYIADADDSVFIAEQVIAMLWGLA